MYSGAKPLRLFLASPGDVAYERQIALEVIDQVTGERAFRGRFSIEVIAWDKPGVGVALEAGLTPQEAIAVGLPKPEECDLMVVIFWSRIGTPLPAQYMKVNGSCYLSGTEWEYENALGGFRTNGKPVIWIYRRTEEPKIGLDEPAFEDTLEQWRKIKAFFASLNNADGSIASGVNHYAQPNDFRRLFEQHLRDRLTGFVQAKDSILSATAPAQPSTTTPRWTGSPYPGLAAFTGSQARIFFGRGPEIDALVERLADQKRRFLAVVGASGTGKSSLIIAGLIPALRKGAIPGSQRWIIVLRFTPALEGDPLVGLGSALARAFEGITEQGWALAENLVTDPDSFKELAATALANKPELAELLIFVDQFEELVTLVPEGERAPFVRLLNTMSGTPRVRVVVTLRADFAHRIDAWPALVDLRNGEGTYILKQPSLHALRQMIEGPAQQAGITLEDGLADRIIEDTGTEPGSFALMAFTLERLYANSQPDVHLTLAVYQALDGVRGSIAHQADRAFSAVNDAAKAALPHVFRELVSVSPEGAATRRGASLAAVRTTIAAAELVKALIDARLLVAERDSRVDIAHETLFDAWGYLNQWIVENAEDLRLLEKVRVEAADWDKDGRARKHLWHDDKRKDVSAALVRLGMTETDLDEVCLAFIQRDRKRSFNKLRAWIVDHLFEIGYPRLELRLPRPTAQARAAILGLAIALIGVAASTLPTTASLEVDLGLKWLFNVRGQRPAPPDVIVVAMDRESAERLSVPPEPRKWPRSLHARLLRNLADAGARVVAFDDFFENLQDPDQDRRFAEAIREAGNVILFEISKNPERPHEKAGATTTSPVMETGEKRQAPPNEFVRAASGAGRFPLPRARRVNQFRVFTTVSSGAPTFPVLALQRYAVPYLDEFRRLLGEAFPRKSGRISLSQGETAVDVAALAQRLRQLFLRHEGLELELRDRLREKGGRMENATRTLLDAMIQVYGGPDSRYLDFYGPPGSITSYPYYLVMEKEPRTISSLEGKAVLVGITGGLEVPKEEYFHTVFSQDDGAYLSGVEIAATALANYLEGRSVYPLKRRMTLLVLVLWGATIGGLLFFLPPFAMLAGGAIVFAAYFGSALYLFGHSGTWVPIVVPLVIQLPTALVGAFLWQDVLARRDRRLLRRVLGHYVPTAVLDQVAQSTERVVERPYGICLATDAEFYTELSERLNPGQVTSLMNSYYSVLFETVRAHGGVVSDVVGDAMLAIWANRDGDKPLRLQACNAALAILAGVEEFNRRHPQTPLPTRVGLHGGQLLLGKVGAGDHYEHRAVGDVANMATRIQGLNKVLGTRILASREAVDGVDGIVTRDLGSFRLAGKSQGLAICEIASNPEQTKVEAERFALFAIGLTAFHARRWDRAANAFREVMREYKDGPARYYLDLCERYAEEPPPAQWDGTVVMDKGSIH